MIQNGKSGYAYVPAEPKVTVKPPDFVHKDFTRLKVVFKGDVQGVGYRSSTRDSVEKAGNKVTGFVMNLLDGTVLANFQGSAKDILDVLAEMSKARQWHKLEEHPVYEELPVVFYERGFHQRGKLYATNTFQKKFNAPQGQGYFSEYYKKAGGLLVQAEGHSYVPSAPGLTPTKVLPPGVEPLADTVPHDVGDYPKASSDKSKWAVPLDRGTTLEEIEKHIYLG